MLLGDPQQLRASRFACCDFALMISAGHDDVAAHASAERADLTLCTAERPALDCAEIRCALVKDSATLAAIGDGNAACCVVAAISNGAADSDRRDQRYDMVPRFSGAGWEKEMSEQKSEPDGELCGGPWGHSESSR